MSVTFNYEQRMDAFSEYRAGFEIRTPQLCTSILIETHPKYEPNRSDYSVRLASAGLPAESAIERRLHEV